MAVTRKGSLRVSYTAAAREPQGRTEDTESCAADFFQPAESAFLFCGFLLQLLKKLCFVCLFCFDDCRIQGQSRGGERDNKEHVELLDARWTSFAPLGHVAQNRRFLSCCHFDFSIQPP